MSTFAQLQTDVGQIIIDLPSTVTAQLPNYIRRAHRRLQRLHNFEVMKAGTGFTTTVNTNTLGAVPADFKEHRGRPYLIQQDGSWFPIEIATDASTVIQLFGTDTGGEAELSTLTGIPRAILRLNPSDVAGASQWQVWPIADDLSLYADGNYRVSIPYWKYLPALSASGDTDWFTTNAEDWLTYQAAAMGYLNNQDPEGAAFWRQEANNSWQEIMTADKRLKLSLNAGTLVPQPRVYGARIGSIAPRWPRR